MQYAICDVETVGLKVPETGSGIVGIAWTTLDPDTLEIQEIENYLTNPGCPIEPGASEIHGIYDADVVDRPLVEEVFLPKGPFVVIAHNAVFDLKFLAPYIENLGGSLCTMILARQHLRGQPNNKLQTLIEVLGLETGQAHDAGGDVVGTVNLLKYLVRHTGRDLRELVKAAARPSIFHVMPFGMHMGKPMGAVPIPYLMWLLEQEIDQNLRYTAEQQMKIRGPV